MLVFIYHSSYLSFIVYQWKRTLVDEHWSMIWTLILCNVGLCCSTGCCILRESYPAWRERLRPCRVRPAEETRQRPVRFCPVYWQPGGDTGRDPQRQVHSTSPHQCVTIVYEITAMFLAKYLIKVRKRDSGPLAYSLFLLLISRIYNKVKLVSI